jgi:hypothetical protein
MTVHPQNCRTCKKEHHYEDRGYHSSVLICEGEEMPLNCEAFTEERGCASWSNGQPQQRLYLITEEQLTELESRKNYQTGQKMIFASIYQIGKDVRSHPYQSERDKVLEMLDALRNELTHKRVYHVNDDHLKGLTFYVKLDDIYKEIDKIWKEADEQ